MKLRKKIILLGCIVLCLCFLIVIALYIDGQGAKNNDGEKINGEKITVSKEISKEENSKVVEAGLKDDTLVPIGEDEKGYGSLAINIKEEYNQVLLCKDPVYDLTYFVNYGVDFYIYRIKDGMPQLAVEVPAKRLFCQGGKLYFMLESYELYSYEDLDGSIYCYDPITGEVTNLIDEAAETMYVDEEGIYYTLWIETKQKEGLKGKYKECYYYSFDTSTIEQIGDHLMLLSKWNDCFIQYEMEEVAADDPLYEIYGTDEVITKTVGIKYKNLDGTKSAWITDQVPISNFSVVDNKFYYIEHSKTFTTIDLETQEKKELPFTYQYMNDYTILDGMIYLGGFSLLNPETGTQSVIYPKNEEDQSLIIHELYTDGEYMYGLCSTDSVMGHSTMRKIEIEEQAEQAIGVTNESGETYEMLRYIYITKPMIEE